MLSLVIVSIYTVLYSKNATQVSRYYFKKNEKQSYFSQILKWHKFCLKYK